MIKVFVLLLTFISLLCGTSALVPEKHAVVLGRALDVPSQIASQLYKAVHERYPHLSQSEIVAYLKLLKQHSDRYGNATVEIDTDVRSTFACPHLAKSSAPPTDVNKVRPADVEIVGALGDSLVAAMGALSNWIFTVLTEYREVSYAGGGKGDVESSLTMPNILKFYNKDIYGGSVGSGGAQSSNARLNVAVSGGKICDLEAQARHLTSKLRDLGNANKWKVLTVMIGPNDLCVWCDNKEKHSADVYEQCLRAGLDVLKAETNNTFVNLVSVFDVTKLSEVSSGFCSLLHAYECPCATNKDVAAIAVEYNQRLKAVAPTYTTDKFIAIEQPWPEDTQVPRKDGVPDTSYFAPDCFHFSHKSHRAASVALWNNMVEAPTKKLTAWVPGEPIECPDEEHPFLRTYDN